jgi:DNA-binding PadR family transcriptional regulator
LPKTAFGTFIRPQGAPRGILAYYILHRIAIKPAHGYELLQEIEAKTEGAWSPGAGSIYPLLKKLASQGYVKSETARKEGSGEYRAYHITPKGSKYLTEIKQHFADAGLRWASMRKIFVEFLGPEQAEKFLVDGSRVQFEMWEKMLEGELRQLPKEQLEYILREHVLLSERHLEWANRKLQQLKAKPISPIIQSVP